MSTPASQFPAAQADATPLRFVTAASLFDGHDAAINIMRRLIQGEGAEVIHLGHNRSVEDVVRAALQMLAILAGFDLAPAGPGSADALHLQIEAKRLVFEDRARYYADPAAAALPIAHLLSPGYTAERRALIDRKSARAGLGLGTMPVGNDTTYLTVADQSGMMVSLIQSNYRGMGSGLVPDGLGFMLQDRGEMFALDPGHAVSAREKLRAEARSDAASDTDHGNVHACPFRLPPLARPRARVALVDDLARSGSGRPTAACAREGEPCQRRHPLERDAAFRWWRGPSPRSAPRSACSGRAVAGPVTGQPRSAGG